MAAIAATAMRAAIRPYSIAVAPLVLRISLRNFAISGLLEAPQLGFHCPPPALWTRYRIAPVWPQVIETCLKTRLSNAFTMLAPVSGRRTFPRDARRSGGSP